MNPSINPKLTPKNTGLAKIKNANNPHTTVIAVIDSLFKLVFCSNIYFIANEIAVTIAIKTINTNNP